MRKMNHNFDLWKMGIEAKLYEKMLFLIDNFNFYNNWL